MPTKLITDEEMRRYGIPEETLVISSVPVYANPGNRRHSAAKPMPQTNSSPSSKPPKKN
jgi:hypothetical protein